MEAVTLCSVRLSHDHKTEPPLGPLYIAAALEQVGVIVDFRDYQLCAAADYFNPNTLVQFLEGHQQTLLISCFVDMLPVVLAATREIVGDRPDTTVILGGPGPSADANSLLKVFPWITAIVRGEGEETIKAWVASQAQLQPDPKPIAGMVYRHCGTVVSGADRPRITNVDDLPMPAYHLINWNRYNNASIITTRGCPFRCTFCDAAAFWGYRSTFRDIAETFKEMECLRERHGKSHVAIVDDTFVLRRDRVRHFCHLLIETGSKFKWGCFGRVNLMTGELIELMARAGCRAVFYGIDSGSQLVLDRIGKSIRAEDILPVLKLSAQCFDKVEASFIWGYPFETLDDFKNSLWLAGEASLLAPKVNVQIHMLSPLPNSPVYRNFQGKLLVPEMEDAPWLLLPPILLNERAGAAREIVAVAPQLFPGLYVFPTIDKQAKRDLLQRAVRVLNRSIGRMYLDGYVGSLIEQDNGNVARALLSQVTHPSDRIGVGLALGMLRRARRRHAQSAAPGFRAGV